MHATTVNFDDFLQKSDADSMQWADGGGAEEAEEVLATFSQEDWSQIKALYSRRGARWRGCLATILRPQQGEVAARLMLDLAWDQDPEVAFLAVSHIAFYCGVNDSADGPFIDLKIRQPSFLSLVKTTKGLPDQIRKVSAACHPRFQRRFELLTTELDSAR